MGSVPARGRVGNARRRDRSFPPNGRRRHGERRPPRNRREPCTAEPARFPASSRRTSGVPSHRRVSRGPRRPAPEAPAAPQTIGVNFRGAALADTDAFPPDTTGAAGPTQFLVGVNGRIRTFLKATGAADGVLDADHGHVLRDRPQRQPDRRAARPLRPAVVALDRHDQQFQRVVHQQSRAPRGLRRGVGRRHLEHDRLDVFLLSARPRFAGRRHRHSSSTPPRSASTRTV